MAAESWGRATSACCVAAAAGLDVEAAAGLDVAAGCGDGDKGAETGEAKREVNVSWSATDTTVEFAPNMSTRAFN